MKKKLVSTTILNSLSYNGPKNLRAYWAGIYLSVIESLVYQKNLQVGFHKLKSMGKPLTFESLKGNTNLSHLNYMLDTTMINHGFEYLIRNMFNSLNYQLVFNHIIAGVNIAYNMNYPSVHRRYYILGNDSYTEHPPIDTYEYLIPTINGFINDKDTIKKFIKHCDAAIELYSPDLKERILILGEVEGKNGYKLSRESFWLQDKQALTDNRYYHFGIGMIATKVDLELIQSLPPTDVQKHLVVAGDLPIIVLLFESFTDLPKDMLFAIEDTKKMIHDGKPSPINSLLVGDFFQSLHTIQHLFLECWSEDVRSLMWKLKFISNGVDDDSLDVPLTPTQPIMQPLTFQKSTSVSGLIHEQHYHINFDKLTPIDSLVRISESLDSSTHDVYTDFEKQTIINSVFTGLITPNTKVLTRKP